MVSPFSRSSSSPESRPKPSSEFRAGEDGSDTDCLLFFVEKVLVGLLDVVLGIGDEAFGVDGALKESSSIVLKPSKLISGERLSSN
mmetsp:Transcript_24333/g.36538  ORF Transcript_24333/g.36538 Transcript_24333/m.36538 type:complete len:86 (+) Transcript_24333:196-453(+)